MQEKVYLKIISGGMAGEVRDLSSYSKAFVMGRSPECDLIFMGVEGKIVSTTHARIFAEGAKWILEDLNSTNGTYINGERISQRVLSAKDIISLGFAGPKIIFNEIAPGEPSAPYVQPPLATHSPHTFKEVAGSFTLDLAHRLKKGNADNKEVMELLHNAPRAERLAKSGHVSQGQIQQLKSLAALYISTRKKSHIAIGGVACVAAAFLGLFIWQSWQYRSLVEKQETLLLQINMLNGELRNNRGGSNLSESERLNLVAKIRAQERLLSRLRKKINGRDLKTLYRDPLGKEIHEVMSDFGEEDYIVPDIFILRVKHYLQTWRSGGRFIKKGFQNKKIHENLILRELQAASLPPVFLYLALHESALDSQIVSRAGARGIWQLMPHTGRAYGLSVPSNWEKSPPELDERTNPLKSTRAAIRYLKELVGEFGSVSLAMASYNAGEGRVRQELRAIPDPLNHRDFWYIYRSGSLPRETNEYLPKIVATVLMDKFPQRYGFY